MTQVGNTLQMMGECLDVYGRGTANGTRVMLWACHGGTNLYDCNGQAHQRWTRA